MGSSGSRTKPQREAGARPAAPARDAASADLAALEGELAARLQALPVAGDGRFTTWRPGAIAAPVAAPAPPPTGRPDDVAGPSGRVGRGSPEPAGGSRRPICARPPDPLDEFFYRPDEDAPEVPAVGAALEARPAGADPRIREEYLTFLLGDEQYAVAIERVREVMRAPPITEVPHAPAHVVGVVTVRGEVVAVFDPRRRLSLPGDAPGPGQGRVVLVDAGEGPCGLLVDAVSSVVRLRPGSIEPRPPGVGGAAAECLAGIGRHEDRLFTVLDLGAFLRRPAAGMRRGDGEERHATA